MTDTIAVSFEKGDDGTVRGMTIHQGGMNLECPREGVEREIEVPLDEIQPLLGTYHDPEEDIDVQVIIYKNRLGIEVPQQGTMEFFPPDDEDRWAFRPNKEAFQIRFNRGADGRVESVTRFMDGKENVMPRKIDADGSATSLPDSNAILQLIRDGFGINDSSTVGNVKMDGKANFVNQGAVGDTELLFSGSSEFMTTIDLGKLGHIRESVDVSGGWSDSSFSTFDEFTGDDLAMARLRHPLWIFGDWQTNLENPVVLRQEDFKREGLNEKSVYVVLFTGKEIPNRTLYVDTESGLIWKEDSAMLIPGIGSLPITLEYGKYQKAGELMLPFEVSSKNDATGELLIQYDLATSVTEKPDYVLKAPEEK